MSVIRCRSILPPLLAAACLFPVQAAGRSLADANFTGPLVTPNPVGMPQGQGYVEPYLVRSDSKHAFDDAGRRHASGQASGGWALVLPIAYGLGERVTGQVNLSAARSETGHARSSGFRAGDTTARLQYLLQAPDEDGTRPAVSVALVQRWATGSHDRITGNPLDAQGDGVQRTTVALGMQQVLWMPNDRPLRWRAQLSASPAPSRVAVSGASVYGTRDGFRGEIARGSLLGLSAAAEYSLSPRWVAVMEMAASRESGQRLRGVARRADGQGEWIDQHRPASSILTIAPAVQYHFSPSVGLIAGVEMAVAGRNAAHFISPQVALGMAF